MICAQFIFKPGTYDDDFHRLDGEIDAFARSLPGFDRVELWHAPEGGVINAMYYFTDRSALAELSRFPQHQEAKSQVQRWYDGYRIVISEVTATYGDGYSFDSLTASPIVTDPSGVATSQHQGGTTYGDDDPRGENNEASAG